MAARLVILLDSDVLVAHLRGVPAAVSWLAATRHEVGPLATSAVSVAEITGGMRSGERREVWRLPASLEVCTADELVARRAGEFMRRYRGSHAAIGTADYLIAATADVRGLSLATLNVRNFPMFKGLRAPFRLPG